jgi:hypothetical protein
MPSKQMPTMNIEIVLPELPVPPHGWNWMTHPQWNDGEPTPVWIEVDDADRWYMPVDIQRLPQLVWAERDADWKLVAAPGHQAAEPAPTECTRFGMPFAEARRTILEMDAESARGMAISLLIQLNIADKYAALPASRTAGSLGDGAPQEGQS